MDWILSKPISRDGYSDPYTDECERVLLTLLSGLGPYQDSLCLVGGLTPRYLVKDRPPKVEPHAGTGDVDLVIDLALLTDTQAYATLEENLERLGFERAENQEGRKQSWRWKTVTKQGSTMIVEFLADDPERSGGKVMPLPTEGKISALNIPHSAMVFDMCEVREIDGELIETLTSARNAF
jgi:hypothetical protein